MFGFKDMNRYKRYDSVINNMLCNLSQAYFPLLNLNPSYLNNSLSTSTGVVDSMLCLKSLK